MAVNLGLKAAQVAGRPAVEGAEELAKKVAPGLVRSKSTADISGKLANFSAGESAAVAGKVGARLKGGLSGSATHSVPSSPVASAASLATPASSAAAPLQSARPVLQRSNSFSGHGTGGSATANQLRDKFAKEQQAAAAGKTPAGSSLKPEIKAETPPLKTTAAPKADAMSTVDKLDAASTAASVLSSAAPKQPQATADGKETAPVKTGNKPAVEIEPPVEASASASVSAVSAKKDSKAPMSGLKTAAAKAAEKVANAQIEKMQAAGHMPRPVHAEVLTNMPEQTAEIPGFFSVDDVKALQEKRKADSAPSSVAPPSEDHVSDDVSDSTTPPPPPPPPRPPKPPASDAGSGDGWPDHDDVPVDSAPSVSHHGSEPAENAPWKGTYDEAMKRASTALGTIRNNVNANGASHTASGPFGHLMHQATMHMLSGALVPLEDAFMAEEHAKYMAILPALELDVVNENARRDKPMTAEEETAFRNKTMRDALKAYDKAKRKGTNEALQIGNSHEAGSPEDYDALHNKQLEDQAQADRDRMDAQQELEDRRADMRDEMEAKQDAIDEQNRLGREKRNAQAGGASGRGAA